MAWNLQEPKDGNVNLTWVVYHRHTVGSIKLVFWLAGRGGTKAPPQHDRGGGRHDERAAHPIGNQKCVAMRRASRLLGQLAQRLGAASQEAALPSLGKAATAPAAFSSAEAARIPLIGGERSAPERSAAVSVQ